MSLRHDEEGNFYSSDEISYIDDPPKPARAAARPAATPAEQKAHGGEPSRMAPPRTAPLAPPTARPTPQRVPRREPLPWMPLSTNEWVTDHRMYGFTDRQYGWLLWLRIEAWMREGYLPTTDRDVLSRFARVSGRKTRNFDAEFGAVIERFFQPTGDGQLEEVGLRQLYQDQLALAKKKQKQ